MLDLFDVQMTIDMLCTETMQLGLFNKKGQLMITTKW